MPPILRFNAPAACSTLSRISSAVSCRRAALALLAGALPLALSWMAVSGNQLCSPFPTAFASVARSAELLPRILGALLPDSYRTSHNELYFVLFLAVAASFILCTRSFRQMALASLLAALFTTPMFHAWYATWLVPFAAPDRHRAVIAFSLSSFSYFWLHYTVGQPGGIWKQSLVEWILLWAPLLLGLGVELLHRRSVRN